jgi:hypothetical protein
MCSDALKNLLKNCSRILFVTAEVICCRVTLVGIFTLFALVSCFSSKPQIESGYKLRPANKIEKSSIRAVFADSSNAIDRTRIRARLELSKKLLKGSFRFSLVSKYPDSLRLELFTTGFPRLVSFFIHSDNTAYLYEAKEKLLMQGCSDSAVLEKLMGFPLNASEMIYWSIGRVPLEAAGDLELIEVARDFSRSGVFKIKQNQKNKGQWAYIAQLVSCESSRDYARILRSQYAREEGVVFSSEFFYDTNQSNEKCRLFPQKISFDSYTKDISGNLHITNLELNSAVTTRESDFDDLFSVNYPSGTRVVPLEDRNRKNDYDCHRRQEAKK